MTPMDPCPICGTEITWVHFVYTDPEPIQGFLDLGWRCVRITDHPAPKLTHWHLDPCGCTLWATAWGWLSMPDEPIHWLHPDEIDRRLNE